MALAENKKASLEAFMNDEITSAVAFADSPTAVAAFKRLLDGWEKYGSDARNRVTETYVTRNPNPPAERKQLSKAGRKPYDTAHAAFHPLLRNYMAASGFGDLLLIDLNGNVIYSVQKLSDYAINLQTPEWSGTPLAEAFQKALTGPADNLIMSEIRQHEGLGIPTGYFATPVSIGRKTIGIMALELPHERIDNLLGAYDGLGDTGNVMLTDADGLALNDSKRTPDAIERMTQAIPLNWPGAPHQAAASLPISPMSPAKVPMAQSFPSRLQAHRWLLLSRSIRVRWLPPACPAQLGCPDRYRRWRGSGHYCRDRVEQYCRTDTPASGRHVGTGKRQDQHAVAPGPQQRRD
ncbi:cache domain-containing protein [Pannonibacter phragmitetus]|uniref:cache domain-containing protein n=1 Tax=Pannonibacter phragmitetus TaxID=121719 RepID=UPI003D2EFE85